MCTAKHLSKLRHLLLFGFQRYSLTAQNPALEKTLFLLKQGHFPFLHEEHMSTHLSKISLKKIILCKAGTPAMIFVIQGVSFKSPHPLSLMWGFRSQLMRGPTSGRVPTAAGGGGWCAGRHPTVFLGLVTLKAWHLSHHVLHIPTYSELSVQASFLF